MTSTPLTPAEIRLAQYGERTSTWSTATYNDGTEKALHEIALGLKAEIDRLRARTLTESEYNAAWHAVEGAAGEEGADPGTVLHAVLDRLGITWTSVEPPAVEESEACGKCKQPFDPADTRFDGHARYYLTPYCRNCVDRCHDNEIADHRCVICA